MGDPVAERGTVQAGSTPIAYSVVRSARRRKTITISLVRPGEVRILVPTRTSTEEIEALVRQRAAWIIRRGALDDPSRTAPGRSPRRLVTGETLPYLGREILLVVEETAEAGVGVRYSSGQFDVHVSRLLPSGERFAIVGSALKRWYQRRAAERFAKRIDHFAPVYGVVPLRVLVRDQRRAWGSCSVTGVLHLNWRLIMAPPPLLDYVVIHELAHLRVRGHSPAFWALVAQAVPDHRDRRAQLRALGPTLEL